MNIRECERIALHLVEHYDNPYEVLEENYRSGLYTKPVYVTIHGFITSIERW